MICNKDLLFLIIINRQNNTMPTKKTVNVESTVNEDISGTIYLSGTYYFQQLHNHYPIPGKNQFSMARIVIKSDKATGPFTWIILDFIDLAPQAADTPVYPATLPPSMEPITDFNQVSYKALRIPVPVSHMSAWLHLLTNAPKGVYYIGYQLTSTRCHAILGATPLAPQPIGLKTGSKDSKKE
jgi:hypothetical protein